MENETTTWAPEARSAATWGAMLTLVGYVALLADHHRGWDLVGQALYPVLAELVVLVEEADLLAREVLLHVLAEDLPLAHVVDLPAERLRVLRVVPARAAGRDEHVGDLLRVEEADRGQVRGRAEAVEHGVHVVLQHQLADHRCRRGRVVGVVEVLVDDLASVHPAVRVDVGEVRGRRGRDLAVAGRGGPGERLVAADGDLGRGDARRGRGQGRVRTARARTARARTWARARAGTGRASGDGERGDGHDGRGLPAKPGSSSFHEVPSFSCWLAGASSAGGVTWGAGESREVRVFGSGPVNRARSRIRPPWIPCGKASMTRMRTTP